MNRAEGRLSPPFLFGRFALAVCLLLLAREYLLVHYLASLMPLVNGLLRLEHLPFGLEQQDQVLLIVCRQPDGGLRRFLFSGTEIAGLATVGAIALFAATPGFDLRWHLRWLAGAVAVFWALDAAVLYAGVHIAALGYVDGLPPELGSQVLAGGGWLLVRGYQEALSDLVGLWSVWGSPLLVLGAWLYAAHQRLLPTGRPATAVDRRLSSRL